MTTSGDAKVAGHYGRPALEAAILCAVQASGTNLAELTAAHLSAVDEFHVGGLEATRELAAHMSLQPGLRLLDIGCGIGGPARYFAGEHACAVSGIDLTEEFVQVAASLTRAVRLDHSADYRHGNALALPYDAASFDRAYTIHVLMNVSDKTALFREVRRVLKPDGLLAIFDIMRAGDGALQYPVPWAASEDTSFVATLDDYRSALAAAGFRVAQVRDRRDFSVAFTARMMARVAQSGPPALGLHLLMGEQTPTMLRNVSAMLQDGTLTAVEVYAVKS